MNTEAKTDLQKRVDAIAHGIQNGAPVETCPDCGGGTIQHSQNGGADCLDCQWSGDNIMSGFDYLSDVLEIQYIVTGAGEYLAARILVAFGGPNICINTQTKTVEGYWGGDSAFASYYDDKMDIDAACRELWDCR
jgi:hypothetical protein